jgi:chorismate dehydratase
VSPNNPLRIAAIRFLNPAPLMWDFEYEPHNRELATRYQIEWMMPAQCAARLALPADHPEAADIGLVPIAALATTPGLKIIPGCAIASKTKVRSLLLIHRKTQPIATIKTVAADTSSRATLAYTQILFQMWGNSDAKFLQHPPDLDSMLESADAAILIGDPALYALEERQNREERTGEELIYLDLAEEWISVMDVPWISAVWAIRESSLAKFNKTLEEIAKDFTQSRDHGLENINTLVHEWAHRMPLPERTIRTYLTENIFYFLDEECRNGLRVFYQQAAENKILPPYNF